MVIGEEASLYATADARGLQFPIPLIRERESTTPGHAVAVVELRDPFVRVQTLAAESPPPCAGRFGVEDRARLQFWVRRSALREVLAEPTRLRFDDGTELRLRPGTPVSRSSRGFMAHVGRHKLPLPEGSASTRLWFATDPPPSLARGAAPWTGTLRYGPHEFRATGPSFRWPTEVGARVTFDNHCGHFELLGDPAPPPPDGALAHAPDPALAAEAAGIYPLTESAPDPCVRWTLGAGETLTWLDGSEAGETLAPVEVATAPVARDGRSCLDLAPGFSVCASPSAVQARDACAALPEGGRVDQALDAG